MKNTKVAVLAIGVLAVGGLLVWAFLPNGASEARLPKDKLVAKGKPAADAVKAPQKRVRTQERIAEGPDAKRPKPTFDIGEALESELTAEQKKVIDEIRAALRADDYNALMRLVRRMQASNEWPDGIPNEVKKAALDALGWYGEKCLPEIVGFLADLNPEIVSSAMDAWEDAIAELDCDRDISKQVILASKVVSNAESMESILSEIPPGMRHSVAVATIKDILASGNELAKLKILETIEQVTGDETIKTAEQLDKWLEENPDSPEDEDMYGGMTDDVGED